MDRDFYLNLIHKQLTEVLTAEEEGILMEYLSSDAAHQRWADEIRISWELGQKVEGIPEVNIEEELARVHQRMTNSTDTVVPNPVVSLAPQSGGQIKSMIPRYMAIAASVLALIAVGFWLFNPDQIGGIEEVKTISATNGTKTIDLSDGSKVWLREGSSIEYAKSNSREITLSGQAFFEVKRDELHTFIVNIDETLVTVLGTSFEILGSEDGSIELQVATGSVSMSNEYDEVILEKGNAVSYNPKNQKITKIDFDDPLKEPWKSGRFIFREEKLENILIEIEDYYGVQIALSNSDLSNCKKTASIPVKSTNEVLQAIAKQFQLSVRKIADTSFILDGDQCL